MLGYGWDEFVFHFWRVVVGETVAAGGGGIEL